MKCQGTCLESPYNGHRQPLVQAKDGAPKQASASVNIAVLRAPQACRMSKQKDDSSLLSVCTARSDGSLIHITKMLRVFSAGCSTQA